MKKDLIQHLTQENLIEYIKQLTETNELLESIIVAIRRKEGQNYSAHYAYIQAEYHADVFGYRFDYEDNHDYNIYLTNIIDEISNQNPDKYTKESIRKTIKTLESYGVIDIFKIEEKDTIQTRFEWEETLKNIENDYYKKIYGQVKW